MCNYIQVAFEVCDLNMAFQIRNLSKILELIFVISLVSNGSIVKIPADLHRRVFTIVVAY
jgi:hypothetical protein